MFSSKLLLFMQIPVVKKLALSSGWLANVMPILKKLFIKTKPTFLTAFMHVSNLPHCFCAAWPQGHPDRILNCLVFVLDVLTMSLGNDRTDCYHFSIIIEILCKNACGFSIITLFLINSAANRLKEVLVQS